MKYRTIVIDPPWKLYPVSSKALSGGKFRRTLPYTQMTDEEILAFPIDNFAEMNAIYSYGYTGEASCSVKVP
jgi:N6-adenosine-specific RNA methylase IME4